MAKRIKWPSPKAHPATIGAIIWETKTPAQLERLFRAIKL